MERCYECFHYGVCGGTIGVHGDASICKQAYPTDEFNELNEKVKAAEERKKEQPIRDNLLVTAAIRAICMDYGGRINLPGGIEGEAQVSKTVVEIVDGYLRMDPDAEITFDEFIESRLLDEYCDPLQRAYDILTKAQRTGDDFDLDEVVGYLGQALEG